MKKEKLLTLLNWLLNYVAKYKKQLIVSGVCKLQSMKKQSYNVNSMYAVCYTTTKDFTESELDCLYGIIDQESRDLRHSTNQTQEMRIEFLKELIKDVESGKQVIGHRNIYE